MKQILKFPKVSGELYFRTLKKEELPKFSATIIKLYEKVAKETYNLSLSAKEIEEIIEDDIARWKTSEYFVITDKEDNFIVTARATKRTKKLLLPVEINFGLDVPKLIKVVPSPEFRNA